MMEKLTNTKLMFPSLSIYASVSVKRLRFGELRIGVITFLARFYIRCHFAICQSRLLFSQHMAEECCFTVFGDFV